MGAGTNWFKRELGKNTGKYVSNKLFGDKWATPHKVIIAKENVKIAKENAKIEKQNSEHLIKTEVKKLEIESKRAENQQKESLNEKKELILIKTFSNDKDEIFDFGNYLISEIKSVGWTSKENESHFNSFSDVCLNKLGQCKIKLDSLGANFESEHFEKEIKSLNNKKLFQKYGFYAGIAILLITFYICHKLGLIK